VAAEFSGCAGLFCCSFGEESLKTVCFDSFILTQAFKWAWSACLKASNPQWARQFSWRAIFAG
jgi:hypothetical protein